VQQAARQSVGWMMPPSLIREPRPSP
jgi:hypothetical protein